MKEALRKAGKQADFKLIDGEGHTPVQQGAKLYILIEMERFVTTHLGK